jgi:hypothetical protein
MVEAVRTLDGGTLPLVQQIRVDPLALGFALAAGMTSTLLFGVAPALHGSRIPLIQVLKEGAQGTASTGNRRMRGALVVAETALAFVLLAGAGLLFASFWQLRSVELGFNPRDVLAARIILPVARYTEPQRQVFVQQFLERVRALPMVQSAGMTSQLPLGGSMSTAMVGVVGNLSVDDALSDAKSRSVRTISKRCVFLC